MTKYLFTSESVTEGHPDKICDQISDAVLDAIIAKDPGARVACETAVTTGMVMIMGEISTTCYVDIPALARSVIKDIGYDRAKFGFDSQTCAVLTSIDEQSGDIAQGVDKALEQREGACDEADTTGAGDCFNAAFLSEIVRGSDPKAAARYAAAASTISIGAVGARTGLPAREQVLAFLAAEPEQI